MIKNDDWKVIKRHCYPNNDEVMTMLQQSCQNVGLRLDPLITTAVLSNRSFLHQFQMNAGCFWLPTLTNYTNLPFFKKLKPILTLINVAFYVLEVLSSF